MNYFLIRKMQKKHNVHLIQRQIDGGSAWRTKESADLAQGMIDAGLCMHSKVIHTNYLGKYVPARGLLKNGQPGSFEFCSQAWDKVRR